MSNTMDDHSVVVHGIQDAILAVHHLMQGNADRLSFWRQAVAKGKMSQCFNVVEHRVAPSTGGFGRVHRNVLHDGIDLVVGSLS
jgi:hypothetical protein